MKTISSKRAVILDGKKLADKIKAELKIKISASSRRPGLAAILIGDDPASELYVQLKEKSASEAGIEFHKYLCNRDCFNNISEPELAGMIDFLNHDDGIDAIILQLPLPKGYDTQKIIDVIDPSKDVDGFRPGSPVTPPTVAGIIELLKQTGENLQDKKTLIIGKSQIFIKGIEKFLIKDLGIKNITTSDNIPANSVNFDILITALGKAHALKGANIKNGAIVIDVGINKLDGKTVGDADPSVADVAGYLSPVPGGVGPLTVACLLRNTYLLSQK